MVLCPLLCYSQFNVKVGYAVAGVEAQSNNDILQSYNDMQAQLLNGQLEKPLSDLKVMSGINLGVSYRFSGFQSLEFGWEHLSSNKEAYGELVSGELFSQELYYRSNQYYISYHLSFNKYGFGIGLGRNRFSIQDNIGNSDVKKKIVSETQNMVRLNLALNLKSSHQVGFSIQPFFHLALDDVGLSELESELDLEGTQSGASFSNYGIRFIFYNGPQ